MIKKGKCTCSKRMRKTGNDTARLRVALQHKKMNNWNVCMEQTETISFENRIPKITLKTKKILKTRCF
jgi:hypothetical protein